MAVPTTEGDSRAKRYDRQIRIWGAHGQDALERAHICLVNAGARFGPPMHAGNAALCALRSEETSAQYALPAYSWNPVSIKGSDAASLRPPVTPRTIRFCFCLPSRSACNVASSVVSVRCSTTHGATSYLRAKEALEAAQPSLLHTGRVDKSEISMAGDVTYGVNSMLTR